MRYFSHSILPIPMSIEARQREEREQRRCIIVDAAETDLPEKGRDDMKMADNADEARLSRSLIYVYFENMDGIVLAVTHRGFQSMRERYEASVAQNDKGLHQIRGIGDAYVAFAQEEPMHFHLVAQFESRTVDPEDAPERLRHRGLSVACFQVLLIV
jgi:AcrR family transcriptional regulator